MIVAAASNTVDASVLEIDILFIFPPK